MISIVKNKIYNTNLISKIKEKTGPKTLKKIAKYLRNLSKEDVKTFSKLKVKVFEEEIKNEKIHEFKIIAPVIGFQHYFEDLKKPNSTSDINTVFDNGGENTPSTVDDNEEEIKQVDSSDISD